MTLNSRSAGIVGCTTSCSFFDFILFLCIGADTFLPAAGPLFFPFLYGLQDCGSYFPRNCGRELGGIFRSWLGSGRGTQLLLCPCCMQRKTRDSESDARGRVHPRLEPHALATPHPASGSHPLTGQQCQLLPPPVSRLLLLGPLMNFRKRPAERVPSSAQKEKLDGVVRLPC